MTPEPGARPPRPARKGAVFPAGSAWPVALALAFLALHLPYLPKSLEDLDSINFALGVRQFDVAHHQPHPPGYPVFILIGKAMHAVVPAEATALALVSVAAGALGVLALASLFARLDGPGAGRWWPLAAAGVAMTTPLYWFTADRPLSDCSGLTAALAVQVMTLAATSARGLAIAGFCAGLAAGVRSQVVWLTAPLLVYETLRRKGHGEASSNASTVSALAGSLLAFAAGVLMWLAPLVIVSGGPAAYWHALADQGAEDLASIQMLWTTHTPRALADAAYFAFAAPWAAWPAAVVVLTCAFIGVLRLVRHRQGALLVLAAAFGPYLCFDLLFQETFTSRYALPLVVPMAYLAVSGLRGLPRNIGLSCAAAIAVFGAHAGGSSIAAYSRAKAPAFRLFDTMRMVAPPDGPPPVLAMDRRESLDLRGPMKWLGASMPPLGQTLAAPPQHEWLEAVKYWNAGGRAPVWFVVDPMRTSIDLVQHGDPVTFHRSLPYPVLLSGVRPADIDWYPVDQPEWYVGEGWSLTPEAAGVSVADGRDLSAGPIQGWVSRQVFGGVMMVGGRNLETAARPHLRVTIAATVRDDIVLPPGPFLRFIDVPSADGNRPIDRVGIAIAATPASRIAIEQFDASAGRPLMGFGQGWHEQEFDPRTGLRWRWLSERGELTVRGAPRAATATHPRPDAVRPLTLHLEGESPRKYFTRGSRLIIRSGDRVVWDEVLSSAFSRDVPIDAGQPIALETDQVFVPSEGRWRGSADRRHLGLRIFRCGVRMGS